MADTDIERAARIADDYAKGQERSIAKWAERGNKHAVSHHEQLLAQARGIATAIRRLRSSEDPRDNTDIEKMSLGELYDLAEHFPLVRAVIERAYYIGHGDGQKNSRRPRDDDRG